MKLSTKVLALAVASVAGFAAQANAAFVTYELHVDPSNPGFTSGSAYSVTAGQTVTMDVYGLVANTNTTATDDALTIASLIFTSSGTAATGGVYSNPTLNAPWNAFGALGSVNATNSGQWGLTAASSNTATGDYVASNGATVVFGTGAAVAGTPTSFFIGTIKYTVAAGAANGTSVALAPDFVRRSNNGNGAGYLVASDGVSSQNQLSTGPTSFQAVGTPALLSLPAGGPTSDISLTSAASHTQLPGTVVVTRASLGNYNGAILPVASATTGSVDISGISDAASPTKVLLWLSGGTSSEAALLADLGTAGTIVSQAQATGQDAVIFSYYDAILPGASLLVTFNGPIPSNPSFFNFTLPAGDTLTAITAVPEPASLGLLAMGGLGLLARRRSSKK